MTSAVRRNVVAGAAVLTALAAIVGVVIGRFWETYSEIGRQKRELRVSAYEELCGSYFEVREKIRRLGMAAPQSPQARDARAEVLDTGARWNTAVATVWLHSTEPVCRVLGELDHKLNESVHRALDGEYSFPEWQLERRAVERTLEEFLGAVRWSCDGRRCRSACARSPSRSSRPGSRASGPRPDPAADRTGFGRCPQGTLAGGRSPRAVRRARLWLPRPARSRDTATDAPPGSGATAY